MSPDGHQSGSGYLGFSMDVGKDIKESGQTLLYPFMAVTIKPKWFVIINKSALSANKLNLHPLL